MNGSYKTYIITQNTNKKPLFHCVVFLSIFPCTKTLMFLFRSVKFESLDSLKEAMYRSMRIL